ncbi:phenylalanine--tRNA ligase subunit alpha [Schaalia sp. lx-260]|uniref:phenylalanine--tRNA ligase subunit alpha n=1 Tax=Schaalia sp. lx-260 TaxID=2899082 RepID=UPI001E5ECF0E|nr:phenylalanine--tRNA ligase subunit alpha [Schaalia sp. lx-260]MCD4550152.1 phenylalanine--tRNA ligase subunit alpha [Schaalia sp. lx-260]
MDQTSPNLNPLDKDAVDAVVTQGLADITQSADLVQLKEVRAALFGDNAALVIANRTIGSLDPSDRGLAGRLLGGARKVLNEALKAREEILQAEHEARVLVEEAVDVTVTTDRYPVGARHPLETLMEDIADFFTAMGWGIAEGPEIEHEWFNFDSLNFDIDHPARQMQDTFYVDGATIGGKQPEDGHLVMRTHTSPVQSRAMLSRGVPLYVACPGKVFRSDALDATHTPVFHQIEGLAVDRGLTMAHLKGVLDHFARAMFGPEAKTRLRPSFFPFTEPSAEMDLWFPQKKGGAGWIEWGGCGMVNPNVLQANGIDPQEYTGFAFGMGLERTLMLRHGIADMHDIVEGDVRFSQQFGLYGKGH